MAKLHTPFPSPGNARYTIGKERAVGTKGCTDPIKKELKKLKCPIHTENKPGCARTHVGCSFALPPQSLEERKPHPLNPSSSPPLWGAAAGTSQGFYVRSGEPDKPPLAVRPAASSSCAGVSAPAPRAHGSGKCRCIQGDPNCSAPGAPPAGMCQWCHPQSKMFGWGCHCGCR